MYTDTTWCDTSDTQVYSCHMFLATASLPRCRPGSCTTGEHTSPTNTTPSVLFHQIVTVSINITMIIIPRASVRLVRNHIRPAAIAAPRGFSGTARRQTYEDDASGQELPPSKSNLSETLRRNWFVSCLSLGETVETEALTWYSRVPIGGTILFLGVAYAYFSSPSPNKATEKGKLSESEAKTSK